MDGRFRDRADAGRRLASQLVGRPGLADAVVLALPRGGVPVAREIADALGADLDVMDVRKLGVPGHEELAMGAIASGGVRIMNDEVLGMLYIPEADIERVAAREQAELERRERAYRGAGAAPPARGRVALLVVDAVGKRPASRGAVAAVRRREAARE